MPEAPRPVKPGQEINACEKDSSRCEPAADEIDLLECLDLVSQAMMKSANVDNIVDEVMNAVFEIFRCDRSWLFYPCDLDAQTFKVLAEKNNPEYPGAFTSGQELPITPEAAQTIRRALELRSPAVFDPESGYKVDDVASRFSVLSQMIMAVHPKTGKPWMFGMHQCAYARIWTKKEQLLFKEISIRVVESLNNLILLKGLKKSEQKYRHLLENLPQKIFHKDVHSVYVSCNEKYANDLKIEADKIVGTTDYEYHPRELAEKYIHDDKRIIESGKSADIIEKYIIDGRESWIHTIKTPLRDDSDKVVGILGIFRDITDLKRIENEKKRLEDQLHQAQKMESVGRLAGGVAHDFNNMLSIILGNAEMVLEDLPPDTPFAAHLQEIHKAATRSTELVKQLLAFARKQTVAPKVLNLNDTLEAMLTILRRLIGEGIDLVWRPQKDLWSVKIDPTQVDQLLTNLCVNARDAIAGVGKVAIATDNVVLNKDFCHDQAGIDPGQFVQLTVSDNGAGMDKEILNIIFEPFFTTKDVGRGNGLGLATVYGIVKQNLGFVNVYSEPDKGTTFKIYFPRHIGGAEQEEKADVPNGDYSGHETVLLVEDEKAILRMTTLMLQRLGYHVIAASSPGEAIRICKSADSPIHLLVTDVVMPEMSGRDLAQALTQSFPEMKCLFMSGYSADAIARHGVLDPGVQFITKPFERRVLAKKLRQVLDG